MSPTLYVSDIFKAAQHGCPVSLIENLRKHENTNIDSTDAAFKTALWISIERGDVNAMSCLIKAGANIDKSYCLQFTPLMLAVHKENAEMLHILITEGAKINPRDSSGLSALMQACSKGWTYGVQNLLRAGADMTFRDIRGKTAVMIAIEDGHANCLDMLLKSGANFNDKDFHKHTPLLLAMMRNDPECVKVLVNAGACVNQAGSQGDTGIMLSVMMRSAKSLSFLLESGADPNIPNKNQVYPILYAVKNGNLEILDLLVKYGARLDVQDKEGSTALLLAAKYAHTACFVYLLEQGAHTETKNREGLTAAMVAAGTSYDCLVAMDESAPLWINFRCNSGKTALTYAVLWSSVKCVHKLLELGADVNTQDKEGITALMNTMRPAPDKMISLYYQRVSEDWESRFTILNLLLEAGANLEISDRGGRTAVMYAAKPGVPVSMMECLTSAGARTIPKSALYMTALMHAAQSGNAPCIKHLIGLGNDVNSFDKLEGWSALMFAAEGNSPDEDKFECLEVLLKNGAEVNARVIIMISRFSNLISVTAHHSKVFLEVDVSKNHRIPQRT